MAIRNLGVDRRGYLGIPVSPARNLLGDLRVRELARETELNGDVVRDGIYALDPFCSLYGCNLVGIRRYVPGERPGPVFRGHADVRRVDLRVPIELGDHGSLEDLVVDRRLHSTTGLS